MKPSKALRKIFRDQVMAAADRLIMLKPGDDYPYMLNDIRLVAAYVRETHPISTASALTYMSQVKQAMMDIDEIQRKLIATTLTLERKARGEKD